ncbi:MAG: phage portal protein [Ruminococcus sp.]|nr:phage portal protein [Ruminococcus sp.]
MGLLDIFKPKTKNGLSVAPTMTGYTPMFTDFGSNIYASDIVVESIRCKANEMKKLDPRHIRTKDGKQSVVHDSSIARVLKRPNELMTTADFLEKITILLELNKNSYIYPEYYWTQGGYKHFTSVYPLKPRAVTYKIDAGNRMFLEMVFASGYTVTLPASDVIHWRKDYGVNDYFGGSISGGNDNRGLLDVLDTYDKLCQGIAKAMECSCQVNGIVRVNTYLDDDAADKKRQDFVERLKNNESGILFADMKTEYTPMPRDVKMIDAETLNFFYQTIARANGASIPILNGDYTSEQKQAYYERALEPDIISLGQAMTKCMITDREYAHGNEIVLYPSDIIFMSTAQKISYMQVAVPAGAMSVNEIRKMGGFAPIDGGDDVKPRAYNSLDGAGAQNEED